LKINGSPDMIVETKRKQRVIGIFNVSFFCLLYGAKTMATGAMRS